MFTGCVELLVEIKFVLNSTYKSIVKQSPEEIVFGNKISKEWCNVYDNTFEINRNQNHDSLKSI